MKKTILLLMGVVVLTGLIFLVKCTGRSEDNTESVIAPSPDDTAEATYPDETDEPVCYQLNEFDDALIAYLCLNGYDSSDFLLSPAAFRASLGLAAVGAQGNTRTELLKAAGFSGMDSLNAWYTSLDDAVAVSVWSSEELLGSFTDSYITDITANYHADVRSGMSDTLTQDINNWTAQKTDGMITDMAEDVDGASSVLISTVNLHTAWKCAFTEASVKKGIFVGYDGHEQSMDFMEQTGEYLYTEEDGVKILVIPMEQDLSFVCFLGNRYSRFDKMTGLHPETVHVVLPEFELTSAFDARDLLGFLLERGINEAISSQTANFYHMCEGDNWFMQELLQKVQITVDEKGIAADSEAVAGTEVPDVGSERKEFVADEPFSFAVFSGFGTARQHMLYYGQMMNGGEF